MTFAAGFRLRPAAQSTSHGATAPTTIPIMAATTTAAVTPHTCIVASCALIRAPIIADHWPTDRWRHASPAALNRTSATIESEAGLGPKRRRRLRGLGRARATVAKVISSSRFFLRTTFCVRVATQRLINRTYPLLRCCLNNPHERLGSLPGRHLLRDRGQFVPEPVARLPPNRRSVSSSLAFQRAPRVR
jgi:hypothetical protein